MNNIVYDACETLFGKFNNNYIKIENSTINEITNKINNKINDSNININFYLYINQYKNYILISKCQI